MIIERINQRDLYQYVDGFELDDARYLKEFLNAEQSIADRVEGLSADDITMIPTKFDYGCGKDYPLDKMNFYQSTSNLEIIEKINNAEYGLSKPIKN